MVRYSLEWINVKEVDGNEISLVSTGNEHSSRTLVCEDSLVEPTKHL